MTTLVGPEYRFGRAASGAAHSAGGGAEADGEPDRGMVTVALYASRPLTRAGLRAALAEAPGLEPVAEAATGLQLDRVLASTRPQVVVIDDVGADLEAADLVRRLSEPTDRRTEVVVLTDLAIGERALEYLRAGARALVLGDGALSDIVAAVRAVSEGHALIAPPLARVLVDLMVRRIPATAASAGLSALTPREQETLGLVAAGMSNQEIAHALFLSEKTVKFHVSNLLGKLGLRNRAQAIVYARDGSLPAGG